jgi:hypothetical protein
LPLPSPIAQSTRFLRIDAQRAIDLDTIAFAQDAVGRLTPAPDPGGEAFAWQPMALQEPTELQGLGQRGAGLQVQADEVTGALRRAEDHLDGDHRGP